MLSRKYYKLIAQVIKNNSNGNHIFKSNLINDLSIEFKADNNLFNRDKFVNACD